MLKKQFVLENKEMGFPFILFLSICTLFSLLWYGMFHSLPLMEPDSSSYIQFSPIRTAGYPFFLWIVKKIFGTFDVVPIVHLCFLTLSATYLTVEFYRLTRRYALASILMIGLMVNPIYHYAFNIMTEALSISLLMVFLGITIRLFQHPTLKKLAMLSTIVGLGILIRPAHYAYVPVLLGVGMWVFAFSPLRFFQVVTATLTPLVILIFLGCWGQYDKNGVFHLESMNGFNMIGKVSLIADQNISGDYPSFLKEIGEFAEPVRSYLDQAPNLHLRYLLSAPYYDYFRYERLPSVSQRIHLDNTVYTKTSWNIIKARPSLYCKDVWMNFCALWQLYDLLTINEKRTMKIFLDSHESPYKPYPWYPNTINFSLKNHPILVWGIRGCLLAICLSSLLLVLVNFRLLWKRQSIVPLVLIGGIASLVVQGHFLLTAMAQAGLPRYSFTLWPGIILIGVIMMELGLQKWKGQFS